MLELGPGASRSSTASDNRPLSIAFLYLLLCAYILTASKTGMAATNTSCSKINRLASDDLSQSPGY
jgi:hypothetical protein